MGFGKAILAALEGFMVFNGRSSRAEFWWFFLFTLIASLVASILEIFIDTKMISIGVNVALFMPLLTVTIRRLHDTGRSVKYLMILLAPVPMWFVSSSAGALTQLFVIALLGLILCLPGQIGGNRFGPDPQNAPDLDAF
ncbi:DUF805 domain-containing protein [Oceanibium sediminis]|uniref:DUF805 domain-containing protein n=1 Tax=Oceanibium sediminis TaxID=2026339 RepID=UPI000DD32B76|nr:DUF805 domain-containing protein [Oceanibium sediminis]